MKKYGEWFDEIVRRAVAEYVAIAQTARIEIVSDETFIASETIGELFDKLIILHIRVWHLEDQVASASDAELLEIEKKLRHCFKVKRPRLVVALNQMLADAIIRGRLDLLDDEDVKTYKGTNAI